MFFVTIHRRMVKIIQSKEKKLRFAPYEITGGVRATNTESRLLGAPF